MAQPDLTLFNSYTYMYIWCGLRGGGGVEHPPPQHFFKCVVGVGVGCSRDHGMLPHFNLIFILNSDGGGRDHDRHLTFFNFFRFYNNKPFLKILETD